MLSNLSQIEKDTHRVSFTQNSKKCNLIYNDRNLISAKGYEETFGVCSLT